MFELLSALCVYNAEGYSRALEALDHYKVMYARRNVTTYKMLLMIVAVWSVNALLNWLFLGLQVVPVQIQRRGWGVARSKGERIPVRSLWKATSRTGSTIASTLYLKWKGERIPLRSFWKATSKTYPWVGCSLKSRGLQQAESRFLCKAGSQLVQGRRGPE